MSSGTLLGRLAVVLGLTGVGAFGACTYTVTPPSIFGPRVYVDSQGYVDLAQTALTIQVSASAQDCVWTADAADGFATVVGAAGGTGNGSLRYSVEVNTTGVSRTTTLNIAGQSITLIQDATATVFSDVLPNDAVNAGFFDGINLMYSNNISKGTTVGPPPTYGSNLNVTRDQMAVFIVRTILGGGPDVDNFNYPATPYFTDVPPTYPFFKWIQKLRSLGITAGTTATTYSPQLVVTRDQMAVFIVRARLGAQTAFNPPTQQQFDDVAPTGPESFYYPYIQELKEIGITSGTSTVPPLYTPQGAVTRGQMAVFLIRAGFNTLLNASAPLLTQLSPTNGAPGIPAFTLTVKGINTHFAQGQTTILSENGVTFGTPTVTDATDLTVTMTIPAGTPLGQISITAQTDLGGGAYEAATAPNVFTVGTGDPAPTITSFAPASGPIGTAVTITGTTLVSTQGLPVTVLVPLQGGGTTPAPVTSASATSVTFVMPSTAASGKFEVLSFSGGATADTAFTITPSSTYTISAAPSTGNVIAGQTTTYTVTASTTNGFSGLANLSVSGLPEGVTGTFNPAQISVGQQSTLTITAPASQTSTTANLAINASATVDGLPVPAAATATLNVTPISTSFVGRTVVDNTQNTSIAGVTVSMVGLDGSGHTTGCTGTTTSDGSGNFALTNLPAACLGPQLIGFNGDTVTSPAGKYAGLQLVFTLVSNTVVASPVLVHLPRVDNVETFNVIQNDTVDQTYSFTSIPGLKVTVYAGTVFTKQDGTQPNPFPLAAIEVPVDRLPDVMPTTTAGVAAFIVAFQPAETNATKAVAVWFPNTMNTPPGTDVPLMTLDPTLGRMAPYGTGTISSDGSTIIPDIDPSSGSAQRRYGIIHFDWHGPLAGTPNETDPSPDPNAPCTCHPVDLSSGLEVLTSTDISFSGNRGGIALTRTYRTLAVQGTIPGPFGWGSFHNYEYRLDTLSPQNTSVINLVMPNGTRIPFTLQADGTLINLTIPMVAGWVMRPAGDGSATLTQKNGAYFKFVPGIPPTGSVLVAIGDTNGNVTNIVRPPGEPYQISEIDDPVGRKLTFQYSGYTISQITDPIGRTVSYTYNLAGYLATFTDVLGGVTSYQYDSQGRVTQITDPHGAVTKNSYDANGRVSSQIIPSGGTVTYAYTLTNALIPTSPVVQTVVTDPLGNATTYRFSTQGFVLSVTDASGQTRSFNRQSGTNFVLSTTGAGTCPVCGNTAAGDMTFTYDVNGNVLSQTDALGNTWYFTYDQIYNHVTSITDPLGNTVARTYDSRGNLIKVTDARGNSSQFTRDATGLITSAQDAAGNETKFVYDSSANLIAVTDALGNKTQLSYDAISRKVAQLDPLGRVATSTYNPANEAISLVDGNGHTVSFSYDTAGLLTSYKDPNGNQTAVTYDSAGRISSQTDPLKRVKAFQYDYNDNLVNFTNRRGQQSAYSYDSLNRVTMETYADATVKRQYDSYGRIIQIVDSQSGTFTKSYDADGRLIKAVSPNGAITYSRDADGRVTTRQVQGQTAATYTYDANSNLTGAASGSTSVTRSYDARDLLTAATRSNDVKGSYAYDALGRLLSINESSGSNTLFSRSFTFDAASQITADSVDAGLALATAAAAGTVDAANEITGFGGTTYTSDADGNRLTEVTTSGTTSYTWDSRGRLQAISAPGGVVTSFLYDPAGQMIQQRVTSTNQDNLQQYILDDASNIVSVQQGDATPVSVLDGRGMDDIMATVQSGSPIFPLADQVGSEGAFTDNSGNVVAREFYEPYGVSSATGTVGLFQFTGRPQIKTGLYYYRARFYDAATGRFISEDSTTPLTGLNAYQYVHNSPLSGVDPTGHFVIDATVGFAYGLVSGGTAALLQQMQDHPQKIDWWSVAAGAAIGGIAGGAVGLLNPLDGAVTLALAGGAAAGVGDAVGQELDRLMAKCPEPFHVGQVVGATLGGAIGGGLGAPLSEAVAAAPLIEAEFAPGFEFMATGSGKELLAAIIGGWPGLVTGSVGGPIGHLWDPR